MVIIRSVFVPRQTWVLALFTTVVLGMPGLALAQSAPQGSTAGPSAQPDLYNLQEIIVTARRREETLQDVPVSVMLATQAILDEKAIFDEETLDKLDPALQITTAGGSRQGYTPAIRGQRGNTAVITYFAEVPQFPAQFFDLQSIQVLKGPQGTLFGETATGGIVLYTPTRPSNTSEGYVTLEAGDYNYTTFEGAVNMPIISDVWSVRLAGQERQRDGYTTMYFSQANASPTDVDNLKTTNLRVSSLITPFQGLEISTVFAFVRSQSNGTGYETEGVYNYLPFLQTVPSANPFTAALFQYWSGQTPPPGLSYYQLEQANYARQLQLGPRVTFADNSQYTDLQTYAVSNVVKWVLNPYLTFKDIAGFTRMSYGPNSGLNPDASEYPVADNVSNVGGICMRGSSPPGCRALGPQNWTNELQVQSELFNGRLTAQGGFYYRTATDAPWIGPPQFVIAGFSTVAPAPSCTKFGLPGQPCNTLTKTESTSYAVYDQETLEIIKDVRLTGGIRQTWDQPIYTYSTAGPVATQTFNGFPISLSTFGALPLPGATTTTFKTNENTGTSYTLSADWSITQNLNTWINHRRGYHGGGINPLLPTSDSRYQYGPETVDDVEVGVRASGMLDNMPVNATLVGYSSNYDNIQRGTFGLVSGVYIAFTQNVAQATIKGGEFSVGIKPIDWFSLSAAAAYTDAKFTQWDETSTCAADSFYAGCGGIPNPTVPVNINHVTGVVTVNGIVQKFAPDVFSQAPLLRFTLTPTLNFGFLSPAARSASLTADITHTSSYGSQDSNYTRGLASKDVIAPGRTLVDMRFNWHNLPWTKADVNLYLAVTNLTNFNGPVAVLDATAACDCVLANYQQPRMYFGGVTYRY
jgi:iron complex outermembrane receptor protein